MQKREFEQAYGRKISDRRWKEIEAAYMASEALDRLDFVAELKASEKARRNGKIAARGYVEILRHDITEAQFRAYIRSQIKGTPLEGWKDYIEPGLGWGNWKMTTPTHDDGSVETNVDNNGYFQTYLKETSGNCYNLIYEFSGAFGGEPGKGTGYFYLFDNSIPGYKGETSTAN